MASSQAEQDAEYIGDGDQVSRAYLQPIEQELALAPESQFRFEYDRLRDERAESVYWRKYAPAHEDVHSRGCALERRYAHLKYLGSRTAGVGAVRSVRSARGHSLDVLHFEQSGDKAHAHIAIRPVAGVKVRNIKPNDYLELSRLLVELFRDFQAHTCAPLA